MPASRSTPTNRNGRSLRCAPVVAPGRVPAARSTVIGGGATSSMATTFQPSLMQRVLERRGWRRARNLEECQQRQHDQERDAGEQEELVERERRGLALHLAAERAQRGGVRRRRVEPLRRERALEQRQPFLHD